MRGSANERFVAGMNSGVMLFRKSKWSQEFLEEVARLGRIPEPELQSVCFFHVDIEKLPDSVPHSC